MRGLDVEVLIRLRPDLGHVHPGLQLEADLVILVTETNWDVFYVES